MAGYLLKYPGRRLDRLIRTSVNNFAERVSRDLLSRHLAELPAQVFHGLFELSNLPEVG